MSKAFVSIQRGLRQAIAHQKGKVRGVKTYTPTGKRNLAKEIIEGIKALMACWQQGGLTFLCCLPCLLVCPSGFGQSTHPRTDKQNTIVAAVVKKLAEPTVCGKPEWAEKEFYVGTIVKREFDESQLKLKGFVIRDKSDNRSYINLDTAFIASLAASASSELADFLVVGRPIQVWAYRCRRIVFAHRISSL